MLCYLILCSVSSSVKRLSSSHHTLLAVTNVLGLAIAHGASSGVCSSLILTPNANKKSLLGLGNARSATSLSAEYAEFDAILLITAQEHVLLVADSNTALLTTLTVSCYCLHECCMFIANDLLCASIFLRLIKIIGGKLETW